MKKVVSLSFDGYIASSRYRTSRIMSSEVQSSLQNNSWLIRRMKPEDIDRCLDIWNEVELTERHLMVASVMKTDPDGLFVAELNESGKIVGMCSGVITRADTGFIGFYAVEPQYQGLGIGRELWGKMIHRLEEKVINVGLYGVPQMTQKYKESGFEIEDSTKMFIYETEPYDGSQTLALESLKQVQVGDGMRVKPINFNSNESLLRSLIAYDESVQRFNREKLLRTFLSTDETLITVALIKDAQSRISAGQESSLQLKSAEQETFEEDNTLSSSVRGSLKLVADDSKEKPCCTEDSPSCSPDSGQRCESHRCANDTKNDDSEILGWGSIIRDHSKGAMLGPIYAESDDYCEQILGALLSRFELKMGDVISVMTLDSNKTAGKILEKLGFRETEQCTRMFTKFIPETSLSKVYYIHSPNFTLL